MALMMYDQDSDAFYLKINEGKVFKTIPIGNDKFLDVDKFGQMIGMEILTTSKTTSEEITEIIRRTESIKISA